MKIAASALKILTVKLQDGYVEAAVRADCLRSGGLPCHLGLKTESRRRYIDKGWP
jgi:hypothetical protein